MADCGFDSLRYEAGRPVGFPMSLAIRAELHIETLGHVAYDVVADKHDVSHDPSRALDLETAL